VSILPQQHCWNSSTFRQTQLFEMVLTGSKRMTFSLDDNICKGLAQWASVVIASLLASYFSAFLFICVN